MRPLRLRWESCEGWTRRKRLRANKTVLIRCRFAESIRTLSCSILVRSGLMDGLGVRGNDRGEHGPGLMLVEGIHAEVCNLTDPDWEAANA